jgi:hypothetical protein
MDATSLYAIHEIYTNVLKHGSDIYDKHNQIDTKSAHALESYATYLNEMNAKVNAIMDITGKFATECLIKATEIREGIDILGNTKDPSKLLFAYCNNSSNLSWADLSDLEDNKNLILGDVKSITNSKPTLEEYEQKPVIYKKMSTLYKTELSCDWNVPIAVRLTDIKPAMNWFNGDKHNPEGLYMCLSDNVHVQVPFPDVLDSTRDHNRSRTVKCKYDTHEQCNSIRMDLAKRYESRMRDCYFAHRGDQYTKIGSTFRCAKNPRFGNHAYLNNDMPDIDYNDIKNILMYSLSDVALSAIWSQSNNNSTPFKSVVMTNIDICQ